MKHRLFIAINLPEDIKKELGKYQNKWSELPVRWVKGYNLHITLVFIGYSDDQGVLEICNLTKEIAQRHKPFSIKLNRVCYGPKSKFRERGTGAGQAPPKPPRMIWVTGESVNEFVSLKNDLEKEMIESENIRFSPENRKPTIHITLGRIRQWDFRRIEPEERPEVDEEIGLTFSIETIELMESQLKKTGAEYAVLESFQLGGKN